MIRKILVTIRRMLADATALATRGLAWLFGTPASEPDAFDMEVDAEADDLRQELNTESKDPGTAVRTLGEHVHAYAISDDEGRARFDFSRVPHHVSVALLTLAPEHVWMLGAAGPTACGRWAMGQRSGIVGIPPVAKEAAPSAAVTKLDAEQAAVLVPADAPPHEWRPRLAA
jgi:hypothetical protein